MAITHNSIASCNFNAFSWLITRYPNPHTIGQSPVVPRPRGVIDTHFVGMVPGMNDRWAAAIGVVYWELDGPPELARQPSAHLFSRHSLTFSARS